MSKDSLARGAQSAQFFTPGDGEVELKNVSPEPKDETQTEVVKIEHEFDFIPYDDKVVLKPIAVNPLVGDIYLTDNEKEPSMAGNVVSVGKNVRWLKKGEVAFYQRYSGVEITIHGEKYLILNEDEFLGKQKKKYVN